MPLHELAIVAYRAWCAEHRGNLEAAVLRYQRAGQKQKSGDYRAALWAENAMSQAVVYDYGDLLVPVATSKSDDMTWSDFRLPYETVWFEGTPQEVLTPSDWKMLGVVVSDWTHERIASCEWLRQGARWLPIGDAAKPLCALDWQRVREGAERNGLRKTTPPQRHAEIYLVTQTIPKRQYVILGGMAALAADEPTTNLVGACDVVRYGLNLAVFLNSSDVETVYEPNGARKPAGQKPKQIAKAARLTSRWPAFWRVKPIGKLKKLIDDAATNGCGRPLDHARWVCGHFKFYEYCQTCEAVNAVAARLREESCKKCGASLSLSVRKPRWCPPYVQGPGAPITPAYLVEPAGAKT